MGITFWHFADMVHVITALREGAVPLVSVFGWICGAFNTGQT